MALIYNSRPAKFEGQLARGLGYAEDFAGPAGVLGDLRLQRVEPGEFLLGTDKSTNATRRCRP